jgi:16S rRNA C967 or C1407 C5-methylase (RsmB/RsmF family)
MNDATTITDDGEKKNINSSQDDAGQVNHIQLCPELQQFYHEHNLDVSIDLSSLSNPWRFVRLNPRYDKTETLHLLKQELTKHYSDEKTHPATSISPIAVPWLDSAWGFYSLPGDFALASSPCFRNGRIYGMDISSGASVAALLTSDHDREVTDDECASNDEIRVLDLCTCPGLKLLTMADFLFQKGMRNKEETNQAEVKVIGVDINSSRMDKCKAIVQKYWVDTAPNDSLTHHQVTVQLHLADGTTFGMKSAAPDGGTTLVFDSRVAAEDMQERGKRKRMNKSAKARERKRLRQIATLEWNQKQKNDDDTGACEALSIDKFDHVLVDAECSTDGSFKHIRERIKAIRDSSTAHIEDNKQLTERDKLADLVELQKKLIDSGFRLLKQRGSMVYSTCSLSQDQNEKVVSWLLERHKDAYIIPIHFPSIMQSQFVTEGSLKGTVRFYPNLGKTNAGQQESLLLGDGFFAAKLGKCA